MNRALFVYTKNSHPFIYASKGKDAMFLTIYLCVPKKGCNCFTVQIEIPLA